MRCNLNLLIFQYLDEKDDETFLVDFSLKYQENLEEQVNER